MKKIFSNAPEKAPKEKRKATLGIALVALTAICAFIAVGVGPLKGNVALMLFLSWLILAPVGAYLGYNFAELEVIAYDMAKKSLPASTIIMAVGIMIATWLASGTVPAILTIGLSIITPNLFLLITMLLCACVSLVMGSSWGTMGTAGIAMFGVGAGLGINPALTVGAIVSGAYFGDKMSPMSDTTLMASTLTGTKLMTHIKYMFITGGPALLISGILYTIIGFTQGGKNYDPSQVQAIIESLHGLFKLGFIPLIPIIVVIVMLILKKNTILTMLAGALLAVFIALFYQGAALKDIVGYMFKGFSVQTDDAILKSLLNRGGLSAMLSLVATFIGALGLGGMIAGIGLLDPIIEVLTKRVKSGKGLIVIAMLLTYICLLFVATNLFAFAMLGALLPPLFIKYNLKSENLSRVLEDCGTLGGVLMPWNVGGIFAAGLFGVATTQYAPYAFQNYLTPIITLIVTLTGFKIAKMYPEKDLRPLTGEEVTQWENANTAQA